MGRNVKTLIWGFGAMGSGMASIPVSYTHLDVYKRQVEQLAKAVRQVSGMSEAFPLEEAARNNGCLLYTSSAYFIFN